jgi:hypothetical protein
MATSQDVCFGSVSAVDIGEASDISDLISLVYELWSHLAD